MVCAEERQFDLLEKSERRESVRFFFRICLELFVNCLYICRKPQGQIMLDDLCRIIRAEGASTFEIDTGKKVYYLTADSNATMDDWIRVLQNVQRRNATKLLLSRDDQKATVQGWVTKVKNGHAKKCWCVLLGKMFLYFKAPGETVNTRSYVWIDRRLQIGIINFAEPSRPDQHA